VKGVENLSAQEFLVLRGLTHLKKGDSIFLDTSDEVRFQDSHSVLC
jgi:hypothetical protein